MWATDIPDNSGSGDYSQIFSAYEATTSPLLVFHVSRIFMKPPRLRF
jgi:hypothetical protein